MKLGEWGGALEDEQIFAWGGVLEQLFHFWFKLDLFRPFLFLYLALLTLSDVFHIWCDFLDKSTTLLGSLPYEFVPTKPAPTTFKLSF